MKIVKSNSLYYLIGGFIFLLVIPACKKTGSGNPKISFRTESGYLYQDTVLSSGDTVNISIHALAPESGDALSYYSFSRKINSGSSADIDRAYLIGTGISDFTRSYRLIPASDTGISVSYVFTVSTDKGRSSSVSLTCRVP